jgi:hypothetical protein
VEEVRESPPAYYIILKHEQNSNDDEEVTLPDHYAYVKDNESESKEERDDVDSDSDVDEGKAVQEIENWLVQKLNPLSHHTVEELMTKINGVETNVDYNGKWQELHERVATTPAYLKSRSEDQQKLRNDFRSWPAM